MNIDGDFDGAKPLPAVATETRQPSGLEAQVNCMRLIMRAVENNDPFPAVVGRNFLILASIAAKGNFIDRLRSDFLDLGLEVETVTRFLDGTWSTLPCVNAAMSWCDHTFGDTNLLFEEGLAEQLFAVMRRPSRQQVSLDKLLDPVSVCGFSTRTANRFCDHRIVLIGEIAVRSERELLRMKNFGRTSLKEVKDILHGMGLSLDMKLDEETQAKIAAKRKELCL